MNINLQDDYKKKLQEDIDRMTQFSTSDFNLANCLVSLGFSVYKIDKSNPEKCQFIFERNSGLDNTINKFWANQLRINPKILFDNQRFLKSRIYSKE